MFFEKKSHRGRPSKKEDLPKEPKIKEGDELKNSESLPSFTFKKLSEDSFFPEMSKTFGFKLKCGGNKPFVVAPRASVVVDTHLQVEIPEGYYIRLTSPSNFGFKDEVVVFEGILESGKHDIKIKLYNHSNSVKQFVKGEVVCNAEVLKCIDFNIVEPL